MNITPFRSQGRTPATSNLFPKTLLSLTLASLALAGCAGQAVKQGPGAAAPAELGKPLMGEFTTASPVHLNDGTRYSTHRLCADGTASLARYWLEAPFDARLSLLDEEGQILSLASQPVSGEPSPILLSPESGECRLLVVSGQDRMAYGPYRLDVLPTPASETETLTLGRAIQGKVSDDGSPRTYNLSVEKPIELELNLLDTTRSLGLTIEGESFYDQARACGDSELRLLTFLQPGQYSLSLTPGQRADMPESTQACGEALVDQGERFYLSSKTTQLPEGIRNGGPLNDGDEFSGIRRERDNEYLLVIAEPSEVTISLSSDAFDTILAVRGDGVELENDDTDSGTNSQLNTIMMPGEYRVLVQSYEDYDERPGGEYRLQASISPFDGELFNHGELTAGMTARGMQSGDINQYTLTVDEMSEVGITVSSDSFDSYLELSGNGVNLTDDDSGGGYNARIQTVLQPGTYNVNVSSYSGSGLFTVTVEQSALDGRLMDSGVLRPGDRVYGTMVEGMPLVYELELAHDQQVRIDTRSGAVDTVLNLSGQGIDLTDDDGGGETHSMLEQYLPAGTYRIEVGAYDSYSNGVILVEISSPGNEPL